MRKFEYEVFESNVDSSQLQDILNGWGDEGWELCSVTPISLSHKSLFIFKREINP